MSMFGGQLYKTILGWHPSISAKWVKSSKAVQQPVIHNVQ